MKRHLIWMALLLVGCSHKPGAGGPPGGGGFAVAVRAEVARVEPLEERIPLVATIFANEAVEVRSEIDGTVASIHFDEGQPVAAGQLLIQLDEEKLKAGEAEAEANFNLAKLTKQRADAMLGNNTISQQEYDQATATYAARQATLSLMQRQLKDTRIAAPFGGITGARLVSPGQVINRAATLTTLVDVDPIKVEVHAPERFLGQLAVGQSIEFRVAAYPDAAFRGEVYFIDPAVDPATRTVLVRAKLANADGRLHPGMFGSLQLTLQVKERAVTVPETALMMQGDQASVFIVDADGKAELVLVEVGIRQAGRVEIASGLQGGEPVVFEGLQKIQPGVPVSTGRAEAPAATAEAKPGA